MTAPDPMSQSSQRVGYDRNKYQSPPPPVPSMTPPPTSQAPTLLPVQARTPTPTQQSHLSSPPPTIKASYSYQGQESSPIHYTSDDLGSATSEELRSMLTETSAALREAKAEAAHFKLQHKLLSIEHSEAVNRMEVELEMTRKEVEVLRLTQYQNAGLPTPAMTTKAMSTPGIAQDQVVELQNRNYLLEVENKNLQRRLSDAKSALLEREQAMHEDNERLRERIRENRRHLNILRRSSDLPDSSPLSAMTTPYTGPLARTRNAPLSTPKPRENKNFEALLLASHLASGGAQAATTPSTPIRHTEPKPKHNRGHSRNSHSLSSLPQTPHAQSTGAAAGVAAARGGGPYYMDPTTPTPAPRARRRVSRDSTISASDANRGSDDEEDMPGSAASQEATSILRRYSRPGSAQSSFSRNTHGSPAAERSSRLLQTQLPTYQVKKMGAGGKRKAGFEPAPSPAKVAKMGKGAEGVGLGIEGWGKNTRS